MLSALPVTWIFCMSPPGKTRGARRPRVAAIAYRLAAARRSDHRHVAGTLPVAVAHAAPGVDPELDRVGVERELAALVLRLELHVFLGLPDESLDRTVGPEDR